MGIEMVMHVVQRVSFWWKTMFLCREDLQQTKFGRSHRYTCWVKIAAHASSTPLYSTPFYSTLLSTLLSPLYSTPLHSPLLHSTPTLLYSTLSQRVKKYLDNKTANEVYRSVISQSVLRVIK